MGFPEGSVAAANKIAKVVSIVDEIIGKTGQNVSFRHSSRQTM